MTYNSDGVPIATLGKEENHSKETTPRPHREVPSPRSRLSITQLIVGASAIVGLLAFSWKSLGSPVVNEKVVVAPRPTPNLDACHGYSASFVEKTATGLTAHLHLYGDGCHVYGPDLQTLLLTAVYETESRIHVKIADPEGTRYQVPESVFPRPWNINVPSHDPDIEFKYTEFPFSFSIIRKATEEVLFDTSGYPVIFEPQYLRVKTSLPLNANIYGLGEHTGSLRLPTENTVRTLWARDSVGVPTGSNLYGVHPIYFEHRTTGTHGVFLLNSNGMDIKLGTENDKTTLEYNIIGGILDFYFLAGPSPVDVARQYAEVAGLPAEVPYWSFGLHQCRWGYRDYLEVAQVISNYSSAGIPLETMWTDIDYMFEQLVFTTDPDYFPRSKMREIVSGLHSKSQHYVMMVDPAIGVRPGISGAYDRGSAAGIWMKEPNGTDYLSIVWPGVTVLPDWFHPSVQAFWDNEFRIFFNPKDGIDIDGVWIDMNEPANFCRYPCLDPAAAQGLPRPRNSPRTPYVPVREAPRGRAIESTLEDGELDLLEPPYTIGNDQPFISDRTARTDVVHDNGVVEYDTHNLFGTMMSAATREAMLSRRPGLRPLVITRSTYAGAGAKVGKWLGDNRSTWSHYRLSIPGMLGFASLFQVPMVGSDVCGFFNNATETLCARWATLGAFNPFYRNHNSDTSSPQEFYRWPLVSEAAKHAIDIRYRLLDYFYTAFNKQHLDGTPALRPLFFQYPHDTKTFDIQFQFFYGHSVLISPVLDEGSTAVDVYFPDDRFYDFLTHTMVEGKGAHNRLTNISFTEIPVHIKGGAILPLRVESAYTTAALRKKDFELVVAPARDGSASGSLYLDDGVSVVQKKVPREWAFGYENNVLKVDSKGKYDVGKLKWTNVKILGVAKEPTSVEVDGRRVKDFAYDWVHNVATVNIRKGLAKNFKVELKY